MKKIIFTFIAAIVFCSSAFAQSGFYMSLELSKQGLDRLPGVDVQVDGDFIRIELSEERHSGLNSAALERRNDKLHLVLGVPVAFKEKDGKHIANINLSEEFIVDSKIILNFSKEVVSSELKKIYPKIPENLIGISYNVKLDTLK